ncbi:hypothetical protein KLP40_14855 [Hymenobacter sp. NST-14]|uniref:BfmA/BtgA family mobilization protein n=1 Tax=Hymenobacter piscis TaxID=2839984 RepID=UPI001C01DC6A|nr:BfmA/BtgA family mobilization protein [Hymenobacter piscis]MBT9394449.1 hypothetical protein [Hymenobacter piscis]
MSERQTKHVLIRATTHRQAVIVAEGFECTLSDYADAAVGYFAERGLDPRSIKARESVIIIDEIRKSTDRLFRFLQVQETGLLLPMARIMLEALNHSAAGRRQGLRLLLQQLGQLDTFDKQNATGEEYVSKQSEAGMDLLIKTLEEQTKQSRKAR